MRKSDYLKVLRRGVAGLVILLLLFGAFAPAAIAWTWPDCNWQCTAKDIRVNRVWLGNCTTGAELGSCVPGTSITACVWVEYENHDNSDRYTIMALDEIWINGTYSSSLNECALDYISGKKIASAALCQLSWRCGDTVELKNLIIPWMTQGNVTCNNVSRTCSGWPPGQCYGPVNFTVDAPLVADFTFDNVCFCTYTTFTDKTTGGHGSYNWSWDFDDDNSSNAQNPMHHYGKNGTYKVTLTVTDSGSPQNTDSQSYDVTVYQNPTADAGDNKSISAGGSVVIGGSPTASDGTSPYTYSWSPTTGLNNTTIANPTALPTSTTTYTVTVTDDNGCTDSDSMTVYFSGIEVVKTASLTGSCPGSDPLAVNISDTVTYCYNVSNNGDVTLTNLALVDSILGTVSLGGTTSLAPNAWATGTMTHVVDENDISSVTNWGNVSSKDPLGSWVNESDTCTINVNTQPEVKLEKSGSPTTVAPGGDVTYTINYTNTGTVPLHNVVITEHYPKGVTFISASPAPDAGTNNVWTIGTLLPGESGTIVIKVKVPEPIDLSFTETGSVIGEGVVMVTKDLSTEQKPYSLKNRVTLSCDELAPVSRYATTKVSGVPGTSLGITESGSGLYSSDEILDLETKNKTIILEKSTHAEYKPTSFNFSDSFSVNFTNKWKQDICSRNMEIDAVLYTRR